MPKIRFTKMHGAGNDFVVLDETQASFALTPAQYQFLADRHWGVGADQILSVRPPPAGVDADFSYLIHNADGGQVAQCGNGARCFARFVYHRGLTSQKRLRVHTLAGLIEPVLEDDGTVSVDMGEPVFDLDRIPFVPEPSAQIREDGRWTLTLALSPTVSAALALVSMGNPHAVIEVADLIQAPVALWGHALQNHPCFPERVNVGFVHIRNPQMLDLRVYERGAGETLACGTGACAAMVSLRQRGLVEEEVAVHLPGGILHIRWQGPGYGVRLRGPATFVFDGEIDLPDDPPPTPSLPHRFDGFNA
jgi:diaminopimelate epimerase